MIRSLIPAFICVILLNPLMKAQEISFPEKFDPVNTSEFSLEITGFKKAEGEVRVAMFDSFEAYKEKESPAHFVVLPVEEDKVTWSVKDLPQGEYAIAVYHDKNKNGKLDTNFLGIPKEAYGFSNDARGKFGPASWSDAHFKVMSRETYHRIRIK